MRQYLVGMQGRLFADPQPGADEGTFQIDNTSEEYYQSPYFELHKKQIQPVPRPRAEPPRMDLVSILGPAPTAAIQAARKISFHAVGDTGAAKARTGPRTEASVADRMAADLRPGPAEAPAFFFHLGDVIYHFGEGQYYYDQFYEPFRAYDRPIFAIPGNHDGMVFGQGADTPQVPTLQAFLRNFCAAAPAPSPDAGGLVRSVMTQPGAYFTLDAPFVSIIGLYSNVLEGPGVITSQGGRYPISDDQLHFLASELTRLKADREAGRRAVVLAVHHPPLSADAKHGGSVGLSQDIDSACTRAGLWPDAVLSGHAHLYQRFTRRVAGREIPYVVSGSGGFAKTEPIGGLPKAPVTVDDHTLEITPLLEFGYLTVAVDMSGNPETLTITFHSVEPRPSSDGVTVNLATHRLLTRAGALRSGKGRRSATAPRRGRSARSRRRPS